MTAPDLVQRIDEVLAHPSHFSDAHKDALLRDLRPLVAAPVVDDGTAELVARLRVEAAYYADQATLASDVVDASSDSTSADLFAAAAGRLEALSAPVVDVTALRTVLHAEHPCAGSCLGCGAGPDEACIPPCRCDEGTDCAAASAVLAERVRITAALRPSDGA